MKIPKQPSWLLIVCHLYGTMLQKNPGHLHNITITQVDITTVSTTLPGVIIIQKMSVDNVIIGLATSLHSKTPYIYS